MNRGISFDAYGFLIIFSIFPIRRNLLLDKADTRVTVVGLHYALSVTLIIAEFIATVERGEIATQRTDALCSCVMCVASFLRRSVPLLI